MSSGYMTLDETGYDDVQLLHSSPALVDKRLLDVDSGPEDRGQTKKKRKGAAANARGDQTPSVSITFGTGRLCRFYRERITSLVVGLLQETGGGPVQVENAPGQRRVDLFAASGVRRQEDGAAEAAKGVVPQYDVSFSGVVGDAPPDDVDDEAPPPPARNCCFNCEGDHMMGECREPRDPGRIAANRRKHNSQRAPQYGRYHQEAEQRFSHLRPGRVSRELRQALGLSKRQLPRHVYRMRVLGYPPGWLLAARLQLSNLSVLNGPQSAAQRCLADEDDAAPVYDHSLLVTYPGYNLRPRTDVQEEHWSFGAPPFSAAQSLERMRAELPSLASGKRQLNRPARTEDSVDLAKVEENRDDSTQDVVEVMEDAAGGGEDEEDGEWADSAASMSLLELEEQRRSLLASLAAEEPLVRRPELPLAQSTPRQQAAGLSLRVDLGTPVSLASMSAGSLPDGNKWSLGITEHIPYENLPGATGAWKRMSSLMTKVRSKVKSITGED